MNKKSFKSGLVLGLVSLMGCQSVQHSNSKDEPFFINRGIIDVSLGVGSTGFCTRPLFGDMNGDGLIDMVMASPSGIKYFENTGRGGNLAYRDCGIISGRERLQKKEFANSV